MGIHMNVKKGRKHMDYLFVDDVSVDCYQNALFRIGFKYDSLKKEQIEVIDTYLQNNLNNLLEILNGSDETSITSGSHEDRIKALENEIYTLTNDVNTQSPRHGTLRITPLTENMDFNKEGTMLKFTNKDNGVYTTSILQNETTIDMVLPVGEYTVNIVNSLNDMTDSVFTELWESATSEDGNHTMKYTVTETTVELDAILNYEGE